MHIYNSCRPPIEISRFVFPFIVLVIIFSASCPMPPKCLVAGVGMTRFVKPGSMGDYPDFAPIAIKRAVVDARVSFSQIDQIFCGYVYGDSTCGQRVVYEVGLSGVPIVNVNNNCSTGSSALFLGRQAIASGEAECVLVVGFEKMTKGSLSMAFTDRTNPLDKHIDKMEKLVHRESSANAETAPFAAQLFGNAGREHMQKFSTSREQIAKIAYKNHKHSINNPYAQFRTEYSLDEILKSPSVFDPLTKLQCCPTSDGAAAAVLVSESFAVKHGLVNECVEIVGQALVTDFKSTFGENSLRKVVGYDMTKEAAKRAFKQAKIGPQHVQVAEVHDCFSSNELITYEALGFCSEGTAGTEIDRGSFTYGGKVVVNPSGGLISKGHPLGATGIAQCAELVWQLRGHALKRQVSGAVYGLQHNLGLGGACVVSIYKKFNSDVATKCLSSDPDVIEKLEKSGNLIEKEGSTAIVTSSSMKSRL